MRASRSSVKFLRVSTKTKGTPRFLCHQSVILGGKSAPSAFAFPPRPPVFPLFQLRCVPGWAHRRGFRALLADVKQKRMESVNDSLTNISPSLFESTVCVRSYCCERKTDGLRDQWLGAWQCRHCEGRNPHGCVDKAAGERASERGRAGW